LLDYLEIETPQVCDGRSLRPLIEGTPAAEPCVSYFESRYLEELFGWAPLLGVERWPYKLIRAPRNELFNLAIDSAESHDLSQTESDLSNELQDLLTDVLDTTTRTQDGAEEETVVDAQMQKALTSLGYVTPGARTRPPGPSGEDPKDHLRSVRLYQQLMQGPRAGVTAADLALTAELVALEPEQPLVQQLRGDYLLAAAEIDSARAAFERAANLAPADPAPLVKLATVERLAGNTAALRTWLAEAVRRDPQDADVQRALAEQAARDGDYSTAEEHYRRALAAAPTNVTTVTHLAALLIVAGRPAEAVPLLKQSLDLNLESRQELGFRYYLLSRALHLQGDHSTEVQAHARRAIEHAPDLPGPHLLLAVSLAAEGRQSEARSYARRYLELEPDSPEAEVARQIIGTHE
jgi:Flp pilus assembly protein TadD